MTKKVLFITWDGPQTSYMEGLFMPILSEVQRLASMAYEIHVVQFTWGTPERIKITQAHAHKLGIVYTAQPIIRKPVALIGSLFSLFKGIRFLNHYIVNQGIDVVMPRSTMPSVMVNRLKKGSFKILFDADGLALEERVDFSGLSKESKQYKFFKAEETKMLIRADGVITRSKKAVAIHLSTLKGKHPEKFSVVLNGRNTDFFTPNASIRAATKKELCIDDDAFVFVYCGSLGPQYGWTEMMAIFNQTRLTNPKTYFLILTGNPEFVTSKIEDLLSSQIIVKKVPFELVPNYLSVGSVAFAIREPKYSMQGVAPIKLGEYLLMGIPTIASVGIGDTEEVLANVPNCFLFNHSDNEAVSKAVRFVNDLSVVDGQSIRTCGVTYFSIEKSAQSYIHSFNKLYNICNK